MNIDKLFASVENELGKISYFEYFLKNLKPYLHAEYDKTKFLGIIDLYTKTLDRLILKHFQELDSIIKQEKNIKIPKEGAKGVYFCLGDSGDSLCVAASLYYDEEDWAANADFYTDFKNLYKFLDDFFQEVVYSYFLEDTESELISLPFLSFSLYDILGSIQKLESLRNAGVAIGFSDGPELHLGHFASGVFFPKTRIVEGHAKPSSVKLVQKPSKEGPLCRYLRHNYYSKLSEEDWKQIFLLGDEYAIKIAQENENIFINKCPKCKFIKKTPVAKLCLQCGAFSY